MKQLMQRAVLFACAVSLLVGATAWAQSVPQPVVRMGDWVEIGDEAFMNIIGNIDIRYTTWHNSDFEDEVQDIVPSRNPTASTVFGGIGDHFEAEIRFGADFRYKKRLQTRIMFETQSVFDGNLIDDRGNANSPTTRDGTAGVPEGNSPHVERFWIDYKWSDLLRTRVGADLWSQDPFGWFGDDDPNFAVFITPNKAFEIVARAVIQTESTRIGLTNDNDDKYYTAGIGFKGIKGHAIRVDAGYFRMRFGGAGRPEGDTFLVIPSWKGSIGIISGAAQFAFTFGEMDNTTGGPDFDVFGYAFAANIKANLGAIQPWFGVVYGSADDNAGDRDLEGFHHFPFRSITLGSGAFEWGLTSPSMGDWGPGAGANAGFAGGVSGYSTTGNQFLDRLGNEAHPGTDAAYSNAGTLRLAGGAHFTPIKGHRLTAYYQYVGFLDDATIVATSGGALNSVDKTLFHEISGVWSWTVNKHFDIRALANIHFPGDGTKDIASAVDCGGTPCEGEDIAFRGTLRFRARF